MIGVSTNEMLYIEKISIVINPISLFRHLIMWIKTIVKSIGLTWLKNFRDTPELYFIGNGQDILP